MKRLIRCSCLALVLVSLFSLWVLPAYADASAIDPTRVGSITLQASCEGTPVPGMHFSLYRIADVSGSVPKISLVEPYASYPITVRHMTVETWASLAVTLRSYVRADELPSDYDGTTNSSGTLSFLDLPVGMYLVIGDTTTHAGTRYEAVPYLISLPNRVEENTWVYDFSSRPKLSASTVMYKTLRVIKVWDDNNQTATRPTRISVQLLRDGQLYETVVLSEENSWRWHWPALDADHEWTVTETAVPGYTMKIELIGDCYRITNHRDTTPPPPTPPRRLPQTGLLWWPAAVLGGGGLLFLLLAFLSRRSALRSSAPAKEPYHGKH